MKTPETVRVVCEYPRIAPEYGLIKRGDKADVPIDVADRLGRFVRLDTPDVGVWVDTEPD